MSLNYYESLLNEHISKNKQLIKEGIGYKIDGRYDSARWKVILAKTKTISIYFTNLSAPDQPPRAQPIPDEHRLGKYYADIYKSHVIEHLTSGKATPASLRQRLNLRSFLGFIETRRISLSLVCRDTLVEYFNYVDKKYNGKSKIHHANEACSFLIGCEKKGLLQSKFKISHNFKREDYSIKLRLENREKKLPNEDVVKACGSIFSQVMPEANENIDLTEFIRDRFTTGLLSIAFASPNRMQAEAFTIVNEPLKKKKIKIKDEEKTIHWINWQGSKGYKDNRNHILKQMAPFVDRSIRWFSIACEPARALCRFYENPQSPLVDILGKLKKLDTHGLPLNKPVNIYQLGGILGLYESNNLCFEKIEGFPFNPDMNFVPTSNIIKSSLFGLSHRDSIRLPKPFQQKEVNLKDLEKYWIDYIVENINNFPYRYSSAGNKVRLSAALLLFRGDQFGSAGAKFSFGGSPFAIESCDLAEVFSKDLSQNHNGSSIFSRYGFAKNFTLTPHQPRHYLNTLAQELNLSDVIIAHWSGRVSVNENATYDHTTEEQKHARIVELYQGDENINVHPITAAEYEKKTGRMAIQMSTGICIQPLHQSPCTYLSDVGEHCIGCHQSCHIKGDEKALVLMKDDLIVQRLRLKEAPLSLNLKTNVISKRWFELHTKKVEVYSELIKLMEDNEIADGSIIRYEGTMNRFLISDLKTKSITYSNIKHLGSNKDMKIEKPKVDTDVLDMLKLINKY